MKTLHVAAGALINAAGEVLINERPAGKPMAGYWEFPGGKLEAGESPEQALVRELQEELGVTATHIEPLLQLEHDYPDKKVILYVQRVLAWDGEVTGLESQALAWCHTDRLTDFKLLPADGPIVTALQLPQRYFITPAVDDQTAAMALLTQAATSGISLVQLRQKHWSPEQLIAWLPELQAHANQLNIDLLVNGYTHLTSQQLMAAELTNANNTKKEQILEQLLANESVANLSKKWLAASCHNLAELQQAARLGCDFAVLGPVLPTSSHPDASGIGWDVFANTIRNLNMPVYALGGLGDQHLSQALTAGAQGVAAISSFVDAFSVESSQ